MEEYGSDSADQAKINLINATGEKFSTIDCEKVTSGARSCMETKTAIRSFVMEIVSLNTEVRECMKLQEDGPYAMDGNTGYQRCMVGVESKLRKVVDSTSEKLVELGHKAS